MPVERTRLSISVGTGTASTVVLRRLGGLVVLLDGQAGRAGQQQPAQVLGLGLPQVGQPHGRALAAGDLDPQLGQPDEPGQQRLHDVDGLQPVQPGLALLPVQDPGAQMQGLVVDRVRRHPPGQQREAQADQHDADEEPEGDRALQPVRQPFAAGHAVPALLQQDDRRQGDDLPAPDEGREGVQPLPVGHSPASRASPRRASRSRSRAASSGGRPGIEASVPGDAVCSCTRAIPNRRSIGPASTSTYCIRP